MILLQCNGKIGQYRYSIFPSGEEGLWSSLRSTLKDRDTGGNIAGPGHGEEYQSSLTRGGRRHGEDGLSCHLWTFSGGKGWEVILYSHVGKYCWYIIQLTGASGVCLFTYLTGCWWVSSEFWSGWGLGWGETEAMFEPWGIAIGCWRVSSELCSG